MTSQNGKAGRTIAAAGAPFIAAALALLLVGCGGIGSALPPSDTSVQPRRVLQGSRGEMTLVRTQPDAEAQAFARACGAGGGGVAIGASECDVVRALGTPITVAVGQDGSGSRRTSITYIEGNDRVVYQFVNDKLARVIR
jgi:hypothetical protein